MEKKRALSIRLTPEANALLKKMAQKFGVTQAAILEMALRRMAAQEGVRRDE